MQSFWNVFNFFCFDPWLPPEKGNASRCPWHVLSLFPSCSTWKCERGECCLIVFLTGAVAGAVVIFLLLCPKPTALLSQASAVWPVIRSQSSSFPRLLVCFGQTQMRGSMRHHVKTLPAQSLKERSLYKCLTYRSYSTFDHLSFCCKKARHHLPPFKIDPKEVGA